MTALRFSSPLLNQPQGGVAQLDKTPLAAKTAFSWVAGNTSEITTALRADTNNTSGTLNKYGKSAKSTSGQTNLEWARQYCTTSDGAGTGDFTFLAIANPSTGSVVEHVLSQKNDADGTPFAQACLLANSGATATAASGAFAFFTYNANDGGAAGASATGVVDGNWHVWIGVRSGSNLTLYRDGVSVATGSGLRTITQSATRYTAVGSRGNGTTESYTRDTAFSHMWNRALSAAEVLRVSLNPWQLFRSTRSLNFSAGNDPVYTLMGQAWL